MSNLMVLANKIKEKFPEAVEDIIEFRDEVTVVVAPEAIVEVATFCRDDAELQFNMLSALSGVDYYPEEPRFAVNYVMNSLPLNHTLRLKVYVPGDNPEIPTVTGVWAVANWPEREVYDMFGVRFKGHYNMRRILLPYDWTGHPLRKDYPLGYEEVQFSFNYERVQSQKPHPRE